VKLIIPTTFDSAFLEALGSYPVGSVYGSLSDEPGARAKKWLPQIGEAELEDHMAQCRSKGIGFLYVMNGSCNGNREFTAEGQRWLAERLGWLVEAGAEGVVATNPYVIEMVKRRYPELRVTLSSIVNLDSVDKALFYEELGVETIYLPEYLNRNFKLLRALRKKLRCELVPILNLSCLVHCPMRDYHANFISHSSECLDRGCYVDYSLAKCTRIKSASPVEVIKAPWIRPEDLARYEEMGFTCFKLAGREKGTEWILRAVGAYAARKYEGKLNDLVIGLDGIDLFGKFPVYLDNTLLDGFIDFFAKRDCRLGCDGCDHCQKWLKRAASLDCDPKLYGESIDRLLQKFVSGSFKAPLARAS
jgi:collagenase-like PrtC family protease